MNLFHALLLALKNVRMHKFRTLLTVLGIIFGVCAVITTLAIIEGASRKIMEEVRGFGLENIMLVSTRPTVLDKNDSQAQTPWLMDYGVREADVAVLLKTVPTIRSILSFRYIRQEVWTRDKKADVQIAGTSAGYADLMKQRLADGRFFLELENQRAAQVCVLGSGAREQLYPHQPAVGKHLKIRGLYLQVIGVLESSAVRGGGDLRMENLDNMVFVPLGTARRLAGQPGGGNEKTPEVDRAVVTIAGQEHVIATAAIVRRFLTARHTRPDFELVVPLELLRQIKEFQQTAAIVAGAIAAISLLVGGIGIMNIMLANVAERRPEIGLRRAVGATRQDILVLFLAEAVILSLCGGALGILLGVAGSYAVTMFAGYGVFEAAITPGSVAIGFAVSALVGILSGSFPAWQASHLDPVVALREG